MEQRLSGSRIITSDSDLASATQSFSTGVNVLNASNGDTFEPTFTVWVDGNENNYSTALSTTKVSNSVTAKAVEITSASLFNTEIYKDDRLAYNSWFDFSTGNEVSVGTYTIHSTTVSGSDMVKLLNALGSLTNNYGVSDPTKFVSTGANVSGDEFDTSLPVSA